MKTYPSWRYHRTADPIIVRNAVEDEALGPDWADSPAAHGIETMPGKDADRDIARRRAEILFADIRPPQPEPPQPEAVRRRGKKPE